MRKYIITISSYKEGKFFFTTDHCQNHRLSGDWVPRTITIPINVVKRDSLPTGVITNKEEYLRVFEQGSQEIPNPQPEFQA